MKFNKLQHSTRLLLLIGCALIVSVVLARAQQQQRQENATTTLGDEQIEGRQQQTRQEEGQIGGNDLFSYLLSPIYATIERAKQFLGHRVDNIHDGIDTVRMQTFEMFMRLYNKTYSPEEIPRRMALFFERRKEIEESIKNFAEGRSLFAMKENEFADWDEDEIKKLTGVSLPSPDQLLPEERPAGEALGGNGGYRQRSREDDDDDDNDDDDDEQRSDHFNQTTTTDAVEPRIVGGVNLAEAEDGKGLLVKADIPASKDWRTSGCVSSPINQRQCGACYAIATMSVVESMHCINRVSAPILSPQQIVDCATERAGYSNFGCDGGWPTRVFKYLQDVGYATRERCYPFAWRQGTCRLRQMESTSGCAVAASPTNSPRIQYKVLHNEQDILYHVANTGPVVTVMKASNKFLYYHTGIFDDTSCSRRRDDVDHAIVIVGYGRERGTDYWLIKNSWGTTTWGEGGYAKYRRGTNACSIGHWGWVVPS